MASSLAKVKIRRAGRKLSWQSWSVGRLVNNATRIPVAFVLCETTPKPSKDNSTTARRPWKWASGVGRFKAKTGFRCATSVWRMFGAFWDWRIGLIMTSTCDKVAPAKTSGTWLNARTRASSCRWFGGGLGCAPCGAKGSGGRAGKRCRSNLANTSSMYWLNRTLASAAAFGTVVDQAAAGTEAQACAKL